MKFALVDDNRIEATKGAKGICPCCGSELTAKCGSVRINHWAHPKDSNCDPWWENETEWHRSWKNNYPNDWQEVIIEKKGNKHIADIYNPKKNVIIEFQNSPIAIEQLTERENFYDRMIWVVNTIPYSKNISFDRNWHNVFQERIVKPVETKFNRTNKSLNKLVSRILNMYLLTLEGASNIARMQLEELVSHYDKDIKDILLSSTWAMITTPLPYEELKKNIQELLMSLLFDEKEFHETKMILNEIEMLRKSIKARFGSLFFDDASPLQSDYYYFDWKHQHKHWNYAKKPIFIDTGKHNIYMVTQNWQFGSGFIVKRFSKRVFLNHYLSQNKED